MLHFKSDKVSDDKLLQLIEVDKERLYKLAYIYMKNEEDAKEIVQETVYKAFINIKKLKNIEAFNGWITKILVNSSMDYIRKRKKLVFIGEEKLQGMEATEKDYLDLYEAVDRLQGLDKTVIILKYFEDYKIKDIALILDISESKVKNHLNKGLKLLRVQLEDIETVEVCTI